MFSISSLRVWRWKNKWCIRARVYTGSFRLIEILINASFFVIFPFIEANTRRYWSSVYLPSSWSDKNLAPVLWLLRVSVYHKYRIGSLKCIVCNLVWLIIRKNLFASESAVYMTIACGGMWNINLRALHVLNIKIINETVLREVEDVYINYAIFMWTFINCLYKMSCVKPRRKPQNKLRTSVVKHCNSTGNFFKILFL